MTKLTYLTPKRIAGEVGGTDGRLDVSARANKRAFYVSRDDGQSYSVTSTVTGSLPTEIIFYFQNTDSAGKQFYVDEVEFGAEHAKTWQLIFVTGTPSGASAVTPVNLNKASSNAATATARGNGVLSGLTSSGIVHSSRHGAFDHAKEDFSDVVILGQNDAIAVLHVSGTSGNAECTLRGYFETSE